MREALSSRPGGHPHGPPLVPEVDDIQQGYAHLSYERRPVRGTPVRLFTFPEGNTDASRTVVCLPGLGASGRSFAPMEPLAGALRLLLWTPPLRTPATHTPLLWNRRCWTTRRPCCRGASPCWGRPTAACWPWPMPWPIRSG
ncbi:hypothetical protein QEG98_41410 [Myxococcus sp. MxC21-1]|nr:hypothetical protein [Myxococcus sp. MxC21-1]WNZ66170.1 hypothetical protein QEG98_41410 [Myxococcus sp. MxC21-1]